MLINTSQPHHQVVPGAFFIVCCPCGYAHDAFSETEADALLEVQARHDHKGEPIDGVVYRQPLKATPYTCREHQTIGKCRECAK